MNRELFALLRQRRMCRSYSERSIPRAHLVRILEAGRRVPSAGHAQGVRFAVVTELASRKLIAEAFDEKKYLNRGFKPWLSVAPAHLVVAVREESYRERYARPDKKIGPEEWDIPYPIMDAGKALMAVYLAAESYGLACGYLGPHAGVDLIPLLQLPSDWRFIGLVTLGYRAGSEPLTTSQKLGWLDFDEAVIWKE